MPGCIVGLLCCCIRWRWCNVDDVDVDVDVDVDDDDKDVDNLDDDVMDRQVELAKRIP